MTRYKQYMKDHCKIEFSEDMEFLPFPVDDNGVILEDRDAYMTPYGILVVSSYNVDVARTLYLPNGKCMTIYDEDINVETKTPCEIRIYHDLPHYMFSMAARTFQEEQTKKKKTDLTDS